MCGSCWAFSTTGALEGAFQIAGNPLTQFSEEELVACDNADHGGKDNGCSGGLMDTAFNWIKSNGLCTEADYPYTSKMGGPTECNMTSCAPAVGTDGFVDVKDEAGLLPAINIGLVSVAVEADKSAFQLYKSGVLDSSSYGNKLDHGVLVVGYGTAGGKAYYKVKNSWGPAWGEKGYLRIVRGKDMCGIADFASYPTGVKPFGPVPAPTPQPTPPPTPGPDAKYKCEIRKKLCVLDSGSSFTKLECEDKCACNGKS
jgi:C1A family cysteine protease